MHNELALWPCKRHRRFSHSLISANTECFGNLSDELVYFGQYGD